MWSAVSAVSAAVATVLVVVAAFYARRQLAEARLARHLTLLLHFQDSYQTLASRQFRRRLLSGEFGSPENFDADKLGMADFHQFWQLADQLEFLGLLVHRNLIDFDIVLATFHRSPPMIWTAIAPYVKRRRKVASPLELRWFENLVNRYRGSTVFPKQFWDRIDTL
jgi:hypothetical protein